MKNLKKFETYINYKSVRPNLIIPNVSYIRGDNGVYVILPSERHDYVEIAGIKWATMNIGAKNVTDTGLYFQWGDTQGYTEQQIGAEEGYIDFTWKTYKYSEYQGDDIGSATGVGDTITKYNSTDGQTVLETMDDAVTAAWGGNWRMPSSAEYELLLQNTTHTTVNNYENSGVNGVLFTSIEDSSKELFFPDGGMYNVIYNDNTTSYWCNDLLTTKIIRANYFDINQIVNMWRYCGMPVRGILDD